MKEAIPPSVSPLPPPETPRDQAMGFALELFMRQTADAIASLFKGNVVSVSANYTAEGGEGLILMDATGGARTVTLPSATKMTGKTIKVKKIDASGNAVAVVATGQTVEFVGSYSLATQGAIIRAQSDGSNWLST